MAGTFALMLHSHIPYCRKSGVWPAGEEWLFEAMNETYLPLLKMFRSLLYDHIRPRVMIGLVPILMEQLADPYMQERFCLYLEDKIDRAGKDIKRFSADPARSSVAHYWLEFFQSNLQVFQNDFYRDILGTLKWLQEEKVIEILTSAATHGFLPLLASDSSVYAQIRIGVETYEHYFGQPPRGFWLPECAYRPAECSPLEKRRRPSIDEWLAKEGLEYFFVETGGLTHGTFVDNRHQETSPSPFRGYRLPTGVNVFGRNEATGRQVWSPDRGYPGDPAYLEFHKKDPESGLHYWRVTGQDEKKGYDPEEAGKRAESHARHFVSLLADLVDQNPVPEAGPVIVSPYDCELFGHWWHEGVIWLDRVCRLIAQEDRVTFRSLSDYLDRHGSSFSTITLPPSTWGLNSDFTVWKNPEHGWIWPYINSSALHFEQIISRDTPGDERARRILQQGARELLLMQGSDWPFLLFTAQAKEYANQRFHHHHQRFQKLLWAAKDLDDSNRLPETELRQMEDIDCPWPSIDYTLFGHREE